MPASCTLSYETKPGSAKRVLDHPVRQRIIEFLGEAGSLSWKELSGSVGVATGALYYHLDVLEGVVVRDEQRRYRLTKQGEQVYNYLRDSPSPNPQGIADAMRPKRSWLLLGTVFAPRQLVQRLALRPWTTLVASLGVSGILVLGLVLTGFSPWLFYLAPASSDWLSVGGYLVSLAALLGTGSASSLILYRTAPSLPSLIPGSVLAFVPIVAFGVLVRLVPSLGTTGYLFTPLLVLSQAWSATFLASAISVASAVRIERTMLVSLAVLYATVVIMLAQGGVL